MSNNPEKKFLRRKEVQAKTGLASSSIYALIEKGQFPKQIQISPRRVAWLESDIDAWIDNLAQKNH